jgi:outer membrane protein OmpA-like peptidoglycan-associated protein
MKKIIRLTESDIYNLVKRVINEQNNNIVTYKIPYSYPNLLFQVLEGRLYWVKRDKKDEYYINGNLNGVLSDFKVHYKTGVIIDKNFKYNEEFTNNYWPAIMYGKVNPINYGGDNIYKFMAIVPENASSKDFIGEPMVYTAEIVYGNPKDLKSRGLKESEDEIISPDTYYKKRGIGYYLQLYPGNPLRIFKPDVNNIPDITPEKSFDLDISSPFKYDSTNLTDPAKIEFEKFIKSVNDKYKNINANVQVTCSSSIDGDPEGKIGNQKRKDYNMELSKRRAETIVTTLKENLKGFKLNYTPIGIGETDQYAPGKKWPKYKQEEDTAPNRRLIIKIQTI